MGTTELIIVLAIASIINWAILYSVIHGATKSKENIVYSKVQYELLKQMELKTGVEKEVIMEIESLKNKSIMEWQEQEQLKNLHKKVHSEPVYFKNSLERAFIRSEPGNGFFIKYEDKAEYKANENSVIVWEGILERKEVKKKKYETGKWL